MKKVIVFVFFVFLLGCSSYQPDERIASMPSLLEQSELPPIPRNIYKPFFRITIKMLIDEKGKVASANLIKGSGDKEWDDLALKSIYHWKFEPGRIEDRPIKMWIVQNARIEISDPYYVSLAEIICDTYEQAATIVSKLRDGNDFGELALLYSSDSSRKQKGYIGKTDVHLYPQKINRVLKKLDVGEFTQPIEYGSRFVIFKRIANGF